NGKDLLTARNLRRHDRTQPHRSAAVDREGSAELRLEAVKYGARAGLDATPQWSQQRQIHVLVHFNHVSLVGHHVGTKGRLSEESAQVGVALVQPIGLVFHAAAK